MAVPKKKTSKAKKGKRRSHWHLTTPNPSKCTHCGAVCRPHRVCRQCGHYGTREVLVVDNG
jgi:large subunit ribosomal protein L32